MRDTKKIIIGTINGVLIMVTIALAMSSAARLFFTRAAEEAAPLVPADEAAEAGEGVAEAKCITRMKRFTEARREEFGKFITTQFQSEKPTSELLEVTFIKFAAYRKEIRAELGRFNPEGGSEGTAALVAVPNCSKAVEADIDIMADLLHQHILGNAYAKKSTRLIDKYRTINDKLEKLNFSIGQFYGYMGTFSQKLPCYATKCVKG